MSNTLEITDVWGQTRTAQIFSGEYDGRDGFLCPFCVCVTVRSERWPRCDNPVCEAQALPGDATAPRCRVIWLDRTHSLALREQETRERASHHRFAMKRLEDDRLAKDQASLRRKQRATLDGQCLECATRIEKFIRHRIPEACPYARKQKT